MRNATSRQLKYFCAIAGSAVIGVCALYVAGSATEIGQPNVGAATKASEASPIYGVEIPPGYRDWKLISINHLVTDKVDQLRAQLGNDIAMKAVREGKLPFPDGAIIAALHWNNVASEDNNRVLSAAFPGAQSFVAGPPVNVQFMVKDSKKYGATGGWGFADFKNGKPGDRALHEACFGCHVPARDHDFVFVHYARAP
jgi:hypothetical protein